MIARTEIPRFVLDSYALIAFLQDEPGSVRISKVLEQARNNQAEIWLTIINYGEVIYITEREHGLTAAQQVIAAIDELPITVVEADRKLTFAAAHIKATHPLSYADAFPVALAQMHEAAILTGDAEFQTVNDKVKIEWLPSA